MVLAVGNELFPQTILKRGRLQDLDEEQTRVCTLVVNGIPHLRKIYDEVMEKVRPQAAKNNNAAQIPERTSASATKASELTSKRVKTAEHSQQAFESEDPKAKIRYLSQFDPDKKLSNQSKLLILAEEHMQKYEGRKVSFAGMARVLSVTREAVHSDFRYSTNFERKLKARGIAITPEGTLERVPKD